MFIVLQILVPLTDELYEHYLARLAVSLEVSAIDGQKQPQHQQGHHLALARSQQETVHLLFQTVVNEADTPRIAIGESPKRLSIWKLQVPLGHPRARLNNPRVLLTCSATLRPAELQKPLFEDDYMTSRQPMGVNLLESFAEDPLLAPVAPRLSAHRVSRVIPVTQAPQQAIRPLGYAAKRPFSIFPAINIRLRYSRIPSGHRRQMVIASLDLEVTPFSECSVIITSVDIAVAAGRASLVGDPPSTQLPVTCRPRDDVTFLYILSQNDTTTSNEIASAQPTPPTSKIRAISVSLEATALVSGSCRPQIYTHWTTTVDFAPPSTPHFPTHAGIHRANRPPSLGAILHGATAQASAGIRPAHHPQQSGPPAPSPNVAFTPPATLPASSSPSSEPVMALSGDGQPGATQGLTVTFTGPSRVYVGEAFKWSVFVVNRSSRARKLALIIPPKRKRVGEGKSLPAPPPGDAPEPVVDEAAVWQSHRSRYLEPAELVPLANDIRIGYPPAHSLTHPNHTTCFAGQGRWLIYFEQTADALGLPHRRTAVCAADDGPPVGRGRASRRSEHERDNRVPRAAVDRVGGQEMRRSRRIAACHPDVFVPPKDCFAHQYQYHAMLHRAMICDTRIEVQATTQRKKTRRPSQP